MRLYVFTVLNQKKSLQQRIYKTMHDGRIQNGIMATIEISLGYVFTVLNQKESFATTYLQNDA